MSTGKRYYWLKLKEDFFRQLPMKKLRRIAGGETYTIIYLKMMLKAIKFDGFLEYDCESEEDFCDNLALDIDEAPDNVRMTVSFLMANKLLEKRETAIAFLPEVMENIGRESASAQRVRAFRKRAKEEKALHCNTDVTLVKRRDRDRDKDRDTAVAVYSNATTAATSQACSLWEQNIGLITPLLAEKITALVQEVGLPVFARSVEKATLANVRNFNYVMKVAEGLAAGRDFDHMPHRGQKTMAETAEEVQAILDKGGGIFDNQQENPGDDPVI